QATGQVEQHGPAADVYSLGAVLYELLTGRAPYDGSDAQTLWQVVAEPPARPSAVRRGVPKPLEAVCLKAIARRPEERYATADELAREVERWLADEPVIAYREPLPARIARWARRHK